MDSLTIHNSDFFIKILSTTRLQMDSCHLSTPRKYPYWAQGINRHCLRAQIWRYWIDLNKRLPQPKIQWQIIMGPHLLKISEKQQPLIAFYRTNIICIKARGVLQRWEGIMQQGIYLLAHKSAIPLVIFAEPRIIIRLMSSIGSKDTVQPQFRHKNKSFIINSQETGSPSDYESQSILINKDQIVREIPVQFSIQPDVLKYLLYLTHSNRSKRMETSILLTLELQDRRIDSLNQLVKVISRQQQRLLEEAFAVMRAEFQARREQESLMDIETLQYIHEICERNQPIKAQIAHFLLPYGLILRMLQLRSQNYRQSVYINGLIGYILAQMRRGEINCQLSEWARNSFLQIFSQAQISYEEIKKYLKMILITQKRPMSEIVPYYYNFFALLINQEAYFQGGGREDLLEYTIQLEIPFFDRDEVGWTEIFGVIQLMEVGLRKRYHSKYV